MKIAREELLAATKDPKGPVRAAALWALALVLPGDPAVQSAVQRCRKDEYAGVRAITELQEKGRFIRISNASLVESHPHDIQITKESPNYRLD